MVSDETNGIFYLIYPERNSWMPVGEDSLQAFYKSSLFILATLQQNPCLEFIVQ